MSGCLGIRTPGPDKGSVSAAPDALSSCPHGPLPSVGGQPCRASTVLCWLLGATPSSQACSLGHHQDHPPRPSASSCPRPARPLLAVGGAASRPQPPASFPGRNQNPSLLLSCHPPQRPLIPQAALRPVILGPAKGPPSPAENHPPPPSAAQGTAQQAAPACLRPLKPRSPAPAAWSPTLVPFQPSLSSASWTPRRWRPSGSSHGPPAAHTPPLPRAVGAKPRPSLCPLHEDKACGPAAAAPPLHPFPGSEASRPLPSPTRSGRPCSPVTMLPKATHGLARKAWPAPSSPDGLPVQPQDLTGCPRCPLHPRLGAGAWRSPSSSCPRAPPRAGPSPSSDGHSPAKAPSPPSPP